MPRIFTYFTLLSVLMLSCTTSDKEAKPIIYQDGTLSSTISIPAGDVYPPFNTLDVPTFFNLGKVTNDKEGSTLSTIVLSKRLGKGEEIVVRPLSLFSFTFADAEYKYLVSSYATVENQRLGNDFTSFMSINTELQMTIENWFRSQCRLGDCKNFEWTQAYKAIRELQ